MRKSVEMTAAVRAWVIALVTVTWASGTLATSYVVTPDSAVTCLDLATGQPMWSVRPGPLLRPTLEVVGRTLRVSDPAGRTYNLDTESGASAKAEGSGTRVTSLPALAQNLTGPDGLVFEYSPGNTRHLQGRRDGKLETVRRLETYPRDLNIVGDLAIFVFRGSTIDSLGGGEVFAYDLRRQRLAWEFDAAQHIDAVTDTSATFIAIDGDRVLVSVEQHILALAVRTGELLWATPLPRQRIRYWDRAWTRFARVGDKLFIACYEALFLLDATSGKLRWGYQAGVHAGLWPVTVSGERVYLGTRKGAGEAFPVEVPTTDRTRTSVVEVSHSRRGDSGFRVRFLSRSDVPRGAPIWWDMARPERSPAQEPPLALEVLGAHGAGVQIELGALPAGGRAFVKFHSEWVREAVLRRGDRVVAKADRSRRER